MKKLDKIQGCLLGGAAGDALGYAVEFLSEPWIFRRFGPGGITEYALQGGLGRISDDTQMTMFTANGLLLAGPDPTREQLRQGIARAYREWYKTQVQSFEGTDRNVCACWLMDEPRLYSDRAPGMTCMSAIAAGCTGTMEDPANDSKGCGGVMRVAPIGLYFDEGMSREEAALLGAQAAALTHGNEMGYIPAALLVHMVAQLSREEGASVQGAALDGLDAMGRLFPEAATLPEFVELIHEALALAGSDMADLDAIHDLGQGWVGDEALAIAIYCAAKYENDFDKALIAAVNHRGDSDSTGAITGNILGARLGLAGIPEKYRENLELSDVILELARDIHQGWPGVDGAKYPK